MDLSRIKILLGDDPLTTLSNKKVLVVGLGGVGSYVVEALVRSGIKNLFIMDGDIFTTSNINRQLSALVSTLGKSKAEVSKQRCLDINPACHVISYHQFYTPEMFSLFVDAKLDYIIDAIDDVNAKIDLISQARKNNIPIISAMGTANKLDATKLIISDISKTHTCPLAKAVRKKLREQNIEKDVLVVFSTESPIKTEQTSVVGSMIFVPASAGLLMARVVVEKLLQQGEK